MLVTFQVKDKEACLQAKLLYVRLFPLLHTRQQNMVIVYKEQLFSMRHIWNGGINMCL